MKLVEIALRDTCVKEYRRTYDKVAEGWQEGGEKRKLWG